MKRRDFIIKTGLATGAIASAPYISKGKLVNFLSAQELGFGDNDSIIIIIELFGGNDGLNTIIPIEDTKYATYRPNIEILPEFAEQWGSSSLYMHPALVQGVLNKGMMGLLEAGRLAVIEGVGYQNPNLSHFRSRDIWQSGIVSSDPSVKLTEGWLGRYIASKLPNFPNDIPEHPIGISLEGTIPLALESSKGHMGISVTNINSFYELGSKTNPTDPMREEVDNFSKEHNFIHAIAQQTAKYSSEIKKAYDKGTNQTNYSGYGLSQKLKTVAKLISGGLNSKIYYVTLGGFDMHVQQGDKLDPMVGQHPKLLYQLATAISEFTDDAVKQGFYKRITGYTNSEFGRRVYDNGSRGSDHGAASMMFVFGHNDGIKGGHLGNPADLSNNVKNGNLFSRPEEDFRNIYTDFLKFRLGASDEDVYNVFQDNSVSEFGVLTPYTSGVESPLANPEREIGVYPNPSTGNINIQFELKSTSVISLKAYSLDGAAEYSIKEGLVPAGIYNLPFFINRKGFYTISMKIGIKRFSRKIIII